MKKAITKNYQELSKVFFAHQKNEILHSPFGTPFRYVRRRRKLRAKHMDRINCLQRQGYTVIPDYLSKQECVSAIELIKKSFERYPSFVHKSED